MKEVSLHVLLWNGEHDLPDLVRSLREITYPNVHIRMLDNGSIDGSRAYVHEHAPEWLVACNAKNVGFAAGHNQLISYAMHRWQGEDLSQKIVVVVNQDMILEKNFLEPLIATFDDASCGSAQPKILRAFRAQEEHESEVRSEIIDTTGLVLGAGWRMEDRGAGQKDEHQFDTHADLIGPGGACAAYRMSALEDVKEGSGYFDEDFFSYREDCDLAMRLVRRGWKSVFVAASRVWHYRGMFGEEKRSLIQRLFDRRKQQSLRNAWATRNQLFFIVKHLPLRAWMAFPRVVFHEGGRVIYGLIFEPETRKILFRALPTFQKMRKKRKEILKNTRISWSALRAYVGR